MFGKRALQNIRHLAFVTNTEVTHYQGDLGEYNQCQGQLRHLYAQGIKGNYLEFTAYALLYTIYSNNPADLAHILAELPADVRKAPPIAHAFKVSLSKLHVFALLVVIGAYFVRWEKRSDPTTGTISSNCTKQHQTWANI